MYDEERAAYNIIASQTEQKLLMMDSDNPILPDAKVILKHLR